MVTINDLPPEIIFRIFDFYSRTESQRNFFNLSFVCKYWKNICANPKLWKKFDGSLSFKILMQLCKDGCLKNTKEIVVSEIKTLKEGQEKKLFSSLTNVETIDLSLIDKLSNNTISHITTHCIKLKEIIIGKLSQVPLTLNYSIFEPFLIKRGSNLTKIQIKDCYLTSIKSVFSCMAKCCPNLEELNITNILSFGTFPTKEIQMHCPNLRVLNLDHHLKVSDTRHESGFPILQIFTYVDERGYWITDTGFYSIVFNSHNLQFLNLTNCGISSECLISIPAVSMEYLYLSRSKVIQERGLADVLKKWSHSLRQVDLSHSSNASINRAVSNLVKESTNSQLEILNLNFSKITATVVEEILKSCTGLKILNLEGCRNLDRGMKRTYSDVSEFKTLHKKVRECIADNPNEEVDVEFD